MQNGLRCGSYIFRQTLKVIKIMKDQNSKLDSCGYDVADAWRSGKWPSCIDDHGGKQWRKTWEFLIEELKRRCPGCSEKEYSEALEKGFRDSR